MQTMSLESRLAETETRLKRRLAETESLVKKRKDNVDETIKERISRDRSEIGRSIIILFVASVLLVLISIVGLAWAERNSWTEASERLVTLLSSVVLPVVTLVIGYYFGTEQQK